MDEQSKQSHDRTSLQTEVSNRFGVLPNFFGLAPNAPEVTSNLWGFAKFGYLDNPLPSLFKERLFVYLSRFCEVRYCISRHVGFLIGLGRPSGDRTVAPETLDQVVRLLRRELPRGTALEPLISTLEGCELPLAHLPEAETPLEEAVFACATHVFLQTPQAAQCLEILRKAVGGSLFQHLLVFLAFVQTAHFWTKLHPELKVEQDINDLFAVHSELADCVRNDPDAATCETTQVFIDELAMLRRDKEQAALLRVTLDSIGDAVITTDSEGCTTNLNPVAESLTGWQNRDAIGRPLDTVFCIISEQSGMPVKNPATRAIREGATVGIATHTVLIAKDGFRRPIDVSAAPIRFQDGEAVGCVLVFRDVTERRQSERRLLESEERVRLALDSAELGSWHVDPATMKLTTDERFRTIFGITKGSVDYEGAVSIIHSDDQSRVRDAVAASTRIVNPQPYAVEYRIVRSDESVRWVFAKGRANFENTGSEARLVSFDGTVADITEQRRSQEELRSMAARLSEADRRKDEFLATLAHELRNPLAPIRTGLEVMKLAKGDAVVMEDIRATMDRQVQQMVRLIDDLLEVSRVTQGKLELRTCRVALADVVRNAIESIQPSLDDANHILKVTLPSAPLILDADPNRLAQVLSNLLHNSIKYTPEGGHIWLSVEQRASDAVITVMDDGIGIPPELQSDIFEMFSQIDRPLEKGYKGLGIGLTLVKRLVEMHGGAIEVQSAGTDLGSQFTVRLPILLDTAAEPAAAPDLMQSTSPQLKILVVDDNTDAASMLGLVVKMLGNEVRLANDGLQAVRVAEEFMPDVVIMDIGMPKMNGYEAARHIRERTWGANIVLVALTGWGMDEDRRRATEAGFDYHLVKPADPSELQRLLAQLPR